MGANVSKEQLENHLGRQEMLIKQLEAVVERQAHQLRHVGTNIDYDAETQNATDDGADGVADELDGVARAARQSEKKKEEPPITSEESNAASIEWSEPTEEEERNFMATK
eukprot:PhM_4_TR8339/c2_g1_i1/m.73320